MALASRGNSGLNPNAPLFVPAAYKQVEDFSPEWWNLVQTSRWFHEYWIRERHIDDSDQQQPNDAEDFSELEFQLEQTLLQGLEDSEDAYYQPEFGLSNDLDKDKLTTEQIPPQPKVLQSETQVSASADVREKEELLTGGLKPEEPCDNLKA